MVYNSDDWELRAKHTHKKTRKTEYRENAIVD